MTTIVIICGLQPTYYREYSTRTYGPFAYLFGLSIIELPWILVIVVLHTLVFYPMVGMYNNAQTIVEYVLAMFVFAVRILAVYRNDILI